MRAIILIVGAIALSGCSGLGSSFSQTDMTYIRADGRPVEQVQIDADLSSCSANVFSGEKTFNCMLAKGYFQVAVADAPAKQAQFAQIAEEKRKQEEARIAEEKRKQEALERAARKKKQKQKKPSQPAPR
jgi:hypothetical protein